jgi:hypothetical protein
VERYQHNWNIVSILLLAALQNRQDFSHFDFFLTVRTSPSHRRRDGIPHFHDIDANETTRRRGPAGRKTA